MTTDNTFLAYECPVHGWEAGAFCDASKDPENKRNFKVLRPDVVRDASEVEVDEHLASHVEENTTKTTKKGRK